jgi:hypothetical protein
MDGRRAWGSRETLHNGGHGAKPVVVCLLHSASGENSHHLGTRSRSP